MYFKLIACEVAVREICQAVAHSTNIVDVEFLTQGLHDRPMQGGRTVQERVDAVPEGTYDAILLGYALCGNLISGLQARHTPLVIPKAHDCITFFLGSRERYRQVSGSMPGAYYYTSGWLESVRRRGVNLTPGHPAYLPARADDSQRQDVAYQHWVEKYGEAKARQLLEVMKGWTENYTHGVLIDFPFTKALHLHEQVRAVCTHHGWQFEELEGDLRLLQHWVDGEWDPGTFLVVPPRHQVTPSYDDDVVRAEPAPDRTGPEAQPGVGG
jgi:hypothetical protein